METKFKNVADYIHSFSGIQRELLTQMRVIVKQTATDAEE